MPLISKKDLAKYDYLSQITEIYNPVFDDLFEEGIAVVTGEDAYFCLKTDEIPFLSYYSKTYEWLLICNAASNRVVKFDQLNPYNYKAYFPHNSLGFYSNNIYTIKHVFRTSLKFKNITKPEDIEIMIRKYNLSQYIKS